MFGCMTEQQSTAQEQAPIGTIQGIDTECTLAPCRLAIYPKGYLAFVTVRGKSGLQTHHKVVRMLDSQQNKIQHVYLYIHTGSQSV